jgi:hypothetical protein
MTESDWKGKLLWTEDCLVCSKPICTYQDLEYPPHGIRSENAILCDSGDIEGCFLVYHIDCFEKHSCSVYKGKENE